MSDQIKYCFLFLCMEIYQENQGKIRIEPRIKLNHEIQLERVTVIEMIEIKAYKYKMVALQV